MAPGTSSGAPSNIPDVFQNRRCQPSGNCIKLGNQFTWAAIGLNKLDLSNPEDRTFARILRTQAEQAGDSVFLMTDQQSISFAEADALSDALAGGLREMRLGAGDRIALYLGNRPETVLLALAANKLGAIWVPINTDYKGDWLLDSLQRSRCTILVSDSRHAGQLVAIREQLKVNAWLLLVADPGTAHDLPPETRFYADLLSHAPAPRDLSQQHYGDTCAILWTSGTTGRSKGVLQSYNSWVRAIVGGASLMYDSREDDRIYCMLPLHNTAAWVTCVLRALIEGIPCIIEERFSVSTFWQRVKHFGATQTFAIGAMGVFLLNAKPRDDDADNSLRVALIVPIPPGLWSTFEQRFGVRLLRSGFGQSECQMICNQLQDRPDVPVYALGFGPNDIELGVFDEQGTELASGATGELCIRPLQPHILFNGYFDDPGATAAAFRDDWYLTGDLVRQDPASGAYFFVDRKRDAVRLAGRNISTLEVEGVVRRHPAIADVAAFGIPTEELASEQYLKLNIVLKPGYKTPAEALCQFINDNAPYYFVPRFIEFVGKLPYTSTNKVQKYKLREQGVGPHSWDLQQSDYQVER